MRVLVTFLLGSVLTGCIPAPYGPYYRPAYPDASSKLSRAYCGGQAGPPSQLEFQGPEGLSVAVSADKSYVERGRGDRPLHILLRLPADSRFRFLSDRFEVATPADPSGVTVEPALLVIASVELPADTTIDFAALGAVSADTAHASRARSPEGRFGSVRFPMGELRGFSPKALRMELPSIALEGGRSLNWSVPEMMAIPPAKGDWTLRYRTPAYQTSLEARMDACRRNTPERSCEPIPLYDPYAFRLESGEFAVRDRLWSIDDKGETVLRHDFEIDFGTTASWRLPDPVFRFTDVTSGEQREHRVPEIHIVWRHEVSLSTPIRANAMGKKPETLLRIDSSLGEKEASRFLVRLPPFVLNGRQHEFKPIEFERRLLDGGLEPFNC